MYVEFDIPHIYLLSNIFIVLRPTLATLKLHCVLVWRDFPIFFNYSYFPVCMISSCKIGRIALNALNIIYLPKSNGEYISGTPACLLTLLSILAFIFLSLRHFEV